MGIKIALVGNPNSGKTTLFNALTGAKQYVGNWPGVTVEKKEGKIKGKKDVLLADLPGIYSLSPYSPEEVISRDYVIDEKPDVIINIVDGTNLERNLYLTTQILELGVPVVIAINMMDIVRKNGDIIDVEKLSENLGCDIVEISALKNQGINELVEKAMANVGKSITPARPIFAGAVEHAIAHIEELLLHDKPAEQQRWFAIKLFERDQKVIDKLNVSEAHIAHIEEDIVECEKLLDDDSEGIIAAERYNYIDSIKDGFYSNKRIRKEKLSAKIDKVLTNKWLGIPIFAGIMFLVYYVAVSTVGGWVTEYTNEVIFGEEGIPALISSGLKSLNTAEWLSALILDGIVAGVGAVLGFVPQLLLLFLMLAFLEECGYMSRVAFIMDRIFRKFGLAGKSFIPLLIGTGCGIPGVMASRTIESPKERRITVITTTFMPCGAKLPIIALIAGAIFNNSWWVAPSAYFLGVVSVVISGLILKKLKAFEGASSPFIMELPEYHLPTIGTVLRSMWERGWSFIKKAGTVILLSTILIWFLSSYGFENGSLTAVEDMNNSIMASIGGSLAWLFIPLGFGVWQATVGILTGLIAKENLLSTLGILYIGLSEVSDNGAEIWGNIQAAFTPQAAYAFLAFNLLCAPCFAAMGAIKREMNSGKWTAFAIAYQCVYAYVVALIINQFGNLFMGAGFSLWTVVAIALLVGMIYLMFRKPGKNRLQPRLAN
ncbi:MAG: ferrous iron transport protein B [Eubacteriales bacterium]|nr:ferrous iron transport protein B [Eubacteriales bacterium]MDY3332339.1 ferrous iron transport protein B [Gallibacter sp.]